MDRDLPLTPASLPERERGLRYLLPGGERVG
jgi:hypothetical protein